MNISIESQLINYCLLFFTVVIIPIFYYIYKIVYLYLSHKLRESLINTSARIFKENESFVKQIIFTITDGVGNLRQDIMDHLQYRQTCNSIKYIVDKVFVLIDNISAIYSNTPVENYNYQYCDNITPVQPLGCGAYCPYYQPYDATFNPDCNLNYDTIYNFDFDKDIIKCDNTSECSETNETNKNTSHKLKFEYPKRCRKSRRNSRVFSRNFLKTKKSRENNSKTSTTEPFACTKDETTGMYTIKSNAYDTKNSTETNSDNNSEIVSETNSETNYSTPTTAKVNIDDVLAAMTTVYDKSDFGLNDKIKENVADSLKKMCDSSGNIKVDFDDQKLFKTVFDSVYQGLMTDPSIVDNSGYSSPTNESLNGSLNGSLTETLNETLNESFDNSINNIKETLNKSLMDFIDCPSGSINFSNKN
ncbi:hypothetical protein [Acanthamoeba polyphaga mimivirus]|nr:hypothetical protein [Acanthamoeba castellanii mamavirus]AHA45385.1 hypothetical protein HIRU_S479 [Hirudovirus strain Sangsue]EJN40909.1 hypothetical protein lvs_R405 [Acanthamoeba polyphaga lentillevirus]UMZ08004.1 hypothetical protein [Acanthamoeba polyphaga mimivirus]